MSEASPPLAWRLVVVNGSRTGSSWPLTAALTTVGRTPPSDIVLGDVTISRRHFVLRLDGDQLILEDDSSTSGTFVNECRVQSTVLAPGDEIRAGQILMRVEKP